LTTRAVSKVQSPAMNTIFFLLLTVALLLATTDAQLKECVNEKNLKNCPTLTATTEPVPQCGPEACYNYCNSQLISCCPKFALSCSVSCPDLVGPQIITAGCRLDESPPTPPPTRRPSTSTCRVAGRRCFRNRQCCSKLCVSGKCVRRQ